jgi:hypothetical protein
MKKLISLLSSAGVLMAMFWGCSDAKGRYLDLATGDPIEIDKNDSGVVINKETKEPVYIYVDTKKNDTIYGRTGEVINGHVVLYDGKYLFDGDAKLKVDGDEYKYKVGDDYKVKVESDGDKKIKDGGKKVKIDDGEKTVKYN